MNDNTLKAVGLIAGLVVCILSFFVPADAEAKMGLFGLGTAVLGWFGFKRPGDATPKEVQAAKSAAFSRGLAGAADPEVTPQDAGVRPRVPPLTVLMLVMGLALGCTLVVACGTHINWPSTATCGPIADAVSNEVREILLEHEDPEQALADLAKTLGERGPETVLCAVSLIEQLFAAKPDATPEEVTARRRAHAFLAKTHTEFR